MHDYIIYMNGNRLAVSGTSAHDAIAEILGSSVGLNLIKLLHDMLPPYNPVFIYELIDQHDKRSFIYAEKIH